MLSNFHPAAVKEKVEEKLPPEEEIVGIGAGTVLRVFSIGPNKARANIAGVVVTRGVIDRRHKVRVLRPNSDGESTVVFDGKNIRMTVLKRPLQSFFPRLGLFSSLKKFKKDVTEIKKGEECGVGFAGFGGVQEKDLIECYRVNLRKRYQALDQIT